MQGPDVPPDDASAISARVTAAYDVLAPYYAVRNAAMPDALVGLGRRTLALAGMGGAGAVTGADSHAGSSVGTSARVLDVGCGAGRDMAWFEEEGARVIGVDRSTGMLAIARGAVRGGLARIDMRALPFPPGAFDIVWCSAALLHLPKTEAPIALAEMRRVLRPGGALALSLQAGSGEVWETGPDTSDPTHARFFARYTADETEALLQRAGFAVYEREAHEARGRQWLSFLAK